jgi:hypothetical protein
MKHLNRFRLGSCGILVLAAVMVAGSPASTFGQADPALGTWTLNVEKSKYSPGPPPKSQTVTIEAAGQGVKVTVKGVDAQGGPINIQYTASYDGKDYPITGSLDYDTLALKRLDASSIEGTRKKAGKLMQSYQRVVSKDGKQMTVTTMGMNAKGEQLHNVAVYEKQ